MILPGKQVSFGVVTLVHVQYIHPVCHQVPHRFCLLMCDDWRMAVLDDTGFSVRCLPGGQMGTLFLYRFSAVTYPLHKSDFSECPVSPRPATFLHPGLSECLSGSVPLLSHTLPCRLGRIHKSTFTVSASRFYDD